MWAYIFVRFSYEVSFIFNVHIYANLLDFSAKSTGHTPVHKIVEVLPKMWFMNIISINMVLAGQFCYL